MKPSPAGAKGGAGQRDTAVLAVLAAILLGALAWREGLDEASSALVAALRLLLAVAPLFLLGIAIGGCLSALIATQAVTRHLGGGVSWRAYGVVVIGGMVTPAGPFAAFPLLLALRQAGVATGLCVAYLTAWATLGLQRLLLWELPLMGADFALLRWAVSLPLPLLAAWGVQAFVASRWADGGPQ
ncbi:hypothetical protein [Algiphilus sp.]|uniref:hypothetical protein n=1 Tax=Algiphilus sp. TaxID=1872431 RepID=UPI003B516E79